MKIVNPNDTTHIINLVPRYNTSALNLDLFLINEETNEPSQVANTYSILGGILSLTFDFEFSENDRFSFKLMEENEVVYRGKIFATTEETQDFKQTNNLYYEY